VPSSASSSARRPWRVSRARWGPWCRPACPSWSPRHHRARRGQQGLEAAILNARSSIAAGRTIAEPLTESKVFPPMVCQMIAVGETTGSLDAMLQKIADFYEDEVDNTVANLMSLMEPAVILFLGVVIGGLVVSMYLPIFQLGSVLN
jgi:type IV pilus assembly protein PilC